MSTATARFATPCITNFVNWVSLEWDGDDYLLLYEFPGEPHAVKILDTPKAAGYEVAKREAAAFIVNQCPIPFEWKSPAARVELTHRWSKSELFNIHDTSDKEKPHG